MITVKAYLNREADGSYSIYTENDRLNYGLIGEGATAQEAIDEWNETYLATKKSYAERGLPFVEAEFSFAYDVPSFLTYYAGILNYTGLSKLTGISSAQLSQYISGYRKPSKKTTEKIQTAINALGQEFSRAQFV